MGEAARECVSALVDGRARVLAAAGVELDALRGCFDRVRAALPERAAELERVAADCGRAPHELLALDGGVVALLTGADIERSLGIHVDGEGGSILGGAWSLPLDEARHVALRPVEGAGLVLGLPGSLGLAGVSAAGHAVIGNVMRPAQAGPGVPGSVLLGQLLAAESIAAARACIEANALLDGRNWMLGDGSCFMGFEQLGAAALLTRVGHKAGHVHANHCFDPSLRQREALPRSQASFRRLELASTIYVQRRPSTAAALIDYFDEVEQAAFADPGVRASTVLAVELGTGLVMWRSHADAPIERLTVRSAAD